jgi:hypothetical protein
MINLISTDMNIIEIKLLQLFRVISFPFLLFGIIIILIYRLGFSGLICLALPIFLFPIQILLGKINGHFFKNIKSLVDQRISSTK